ncbi:YdgA family protein [Glaciecola sp. MH2013]|uniref:YdgA family protein n=1 Tax=Glaciecola sp. MH2013 TaxID=2785524 RepID=UPI00189DDCF4|nr:YdgA family protein [Glaciecola sp. MH2013]MBF7073346.1 YdgA family protein [Glaciecola sp. MH2013]
MKKIIIPIATLAAVGLIGPKVTGNGFNSSLDSFIESVNANPGYTATIDSRSIGWFSTEAVLTFGLPTDMYEDLGLSASDIAELSDTMSFTLNIEAQHGPVLTLNGFGLGLSAFKSTSNEDTFREYLDYAADKRFYSLAGEVGLFGGTSYTDAIPSFSVNAENNNGNDVLFSGWNGVGTDGDSSTYSGEMAEFTVVGEGNDLKVADVKLDLNIELPLSEVLNNVFYNSSSTFSVGSVVLNMPVEEIGFDMHNVVVDFISTTSKDAALMDMDINYAIESLSAPEFKAKELVVKTEINNLERVLFETLQELGNDPLQMEAAMQDLMENKLLPQLAANPEINITELSGSINGGTIDAKVLTKLQGIEEMPTMLEDPSFWISKAILDADINMDKTMAMYVGSQVVASQMAADPSTSGMSDDEIMQIASQQVEGMLGMFAAQGMLVVSEEGDYSMTFKLENGEALLNGNPMPLPL